jgi:acetaldehyde dehydrogenase/alcohol dehydrogenase
LSIPTADDLLQRAALAGAEYYQLSQKQIDHIVRKTAEAAFAARVKLAKMAYEETNIGRWEDKVIKNVVATQFVYNDIKGLKTVGIISDNKETGIVEIAQPMGPILAIIPVTNPTSTTIFKILIALKSRNPIIICPSKKATNCCAETTRICYEAALEAGAPEDSIQCVTDVSRELTHALMSHKKLALILATGGESLVSAAYSSGNPALGVGAGNVPVFIEKSADITFAAEQVFMSKTFDNGTICASEQAIVVEKPVSGSVINEFKKLGAYFLSAEETKRLEPVVFDSAKSSMNGAIVGKTAKYIAELAGLNVPEETKLLVAPLNGVGADYPISHEILAPVIAFYEADDFDSALKICIDLNFHGGIGHTASIFSNDEEKIYEFSSHMNAGRIVVNTPSSQGAVGALYNKLSASLTLGCGTGGKNITTDNVTAKHLLNIQRIARRRSNELLMRFDTNKYFDENLGLDAIESEFYKNC